MWSSALHSVIYHCFTYQIIIMSGTPFSPNCTASEAQTCQVSRNDFTIRDLRLLARRSTYFKMWLSKHLPVTAKRSPADEEQTMTVKLGFPFEPDSDHQPPSPGEDGTPFSAQYFAHHYQPLPLRFYSFYKCIYFLLQTSDYPSALDFATFCTGLPAHDILDAAIFLDSHLLIEAWIGKMIASMSAQTAVDTYTAIAKQIITQPSDTYNKDRVSQLTNVINTITSLHPISVMPFLFAFPTAIALSAIDKTNFPCYSYNLVLPNSPPDAQDPYSDPQTHSLPPPHPIITTYLEDLILISIEQYDHLCAEQQRWATFNFSCTICLRPGEDVTGKRRFLLPCCQYPVHKECYEWLYEGPARIGVSVTCNHCHKVPTLCAIINYSVAMSTSSSADASDGSGPSEVQVYQSNPDNPST